MADREAAVRTQIELWYAEAAGPEALAEEPSEPFEATAHYVVMNDYDIDNDYRSIAMTALDVLRLAYSSEFPSVIRIDEMDAAELARLIVGANANWARAVRYQIGKYLAFKAAADE